MSMFIESDALSRNASSDTILNSGSFFVKYSAIIGIYLLLRTKMVILFGEIPLSISLCNQFLISSKTQYW